VIVGTIHSVKGGEADVVFLFPDLSPAGDAAYQKHGPQRDSVIEGPWSEPDGSDGLTLLRCTQRHRVRVSRLGAEVHAFLRARYLPVPYQPLVTCKERALTGDQVFHEQ
jgi:hypothetical protein